MLTDGCPLCMKKRADAHPKVQGVAICRSCRAHYTTRRIYLGDSYGVVLPHFTRDRSADERQVYFDLDTLGSAGAGRRHGWFDPETRLLTQVG